MRQQKDRAYGDLLSRLRVGAITAEDMNLLETRKFDIKSPNTVNRVCLLPSYMKNLPPDIVCLLAIRKQCECLNTIMLEELPTDKIVLMAEDSIEGRNPRLKAAAKRILAKAEEDDRSSTGLAKIITIKIWTKFMIIRNIDVTIGLVNRTIGVITSVSKCIDKAVEQVQSITIRLSSGQECQIERMDVKFEIMKETYITRRQVPISQSYGIKIHKSQGLSLHNAVMDVG
ncbi:ATP-dependent DNA helicase PIF1-like [Diachasma alloeum]|uniref:ATP-dependent DNA helicase PIF1-like n=1 Tax=Diachasma alloeum TaxID=454923 RepID=UPI0007381A62|nr:ATP-dependent DNA helicase PIF1-like [Diachasma alloeum]